MDNAKSKFSYVAQTSEGDLSKEIEVSLNDYRAAASQNMSFKQYINSKCSDAAPKFGDAFTQAVQAMGLQNKFHGNVSGSMSPTIAQIYRGLDAGPASNLQMSTIVAPDGSDTTPAGRIFFPEVVMDILRETLLRDNTDVETGFASMIAVTDNIAGSAYIQPRVNVTSNEAVAAQPIGQGADPAVMVNITSSQSTRTIPTKSIGLQITDQALNYATLDLVGTALAAQSRGERIRMVEGDIANIIGGDTDSGITALSGVTAQSYDSAIVAAGTVTHKAFLKMLHTNYQYRSIDSAIMDIDTFLAFQERAGRPTVDKDQGRDNRLNTNIQPLNFSLQDLNILLVDTAVVGANTALFMDSRYALRRVVDVSAQYEAVQQFVMRRLNQMRMDYGEHTTRLYDQAHLLVTLTV